MGAGCQNWRNLTRNSHQCGGMAGVIWSKWLPINSQKCPQVIPHPYYTHSGPCEDFYSRGSLFSTKFGNVEPLTLDPPKMPKRDGRILHIHAARPVYISEFDNCIFFKTSHGCVWSFFYPFGCSQTPRPYTKTKEQTELFQKVFGPVAFH